MTATLSVRISREATHGTGFDPDWFGAAAENYAASIVAWRNSKGRYIVVNGQHVYNRDGWPEPEKPTRDTHTRAAVVACPPPVVAADDPVELERKRKADRHIKIKALRKVVTDALGDGSTPPTETRRFPGREEWVVVFVTEHTTAIRVTSMQAAKLVTDKRLVVALGKPPGRRARKGTKQ